MPNWCTNSVTISHAEPEALERLAAAVREGKFLNFAIPVPEELNIVAGRVGADDNPDQIDLERREAENLKKYGAKNWYDFCVSRWGTKWEVEAYEGQSVEVSEGVVSFGFDSAWSPPCGVYEELVEQGYSVTAYYYEPGMGYCGRWEDGDDDYYDLGGMNSKSVAATIPQDLDDVMCISENMAEYEAENEEETDELTEWYEEGVDSKGLEPHK